MKNKKILVYITLIAILLIAVFFRLWQLDKTPPGLYPDVAINGNNALDSLKNNDYKVFYPENNGREGLFMWLIALSFSIFGVKVWAIEIVSAIFGIFTVLGVYLLAKQIFKRINQNYELIALISSFFLAISFWHVNFSRIGFRAIMVPFFLAYGFYFLFKALDDKKTLFAVLSGIFFGLGFYSYISYRFVVVLGLLLFIAWFYLLKKQRKEVLKISLYCLVAMILVALPLGLYFIMNPQDFFGRAAGVSILNDNNPLLSLGKSILYNLGMFNVYGDANWRHNISGAPELIWPVGVFFLLGLVILIKDLFVYYKKKKFEAFIPSLFLISWFFILLLPCFLSSEGIPHSLRAVGVIPAIYIISGLGAAVLLGFLKKFFNHKFVFIALISLFVFILIGAEFTRYFYQWAKNKEVYGAFTQNYADIGTYLNLLPNDTQKFVVVNDSGVLVNGVPMPAQTPMFIEKTGYGYVRSTYLVSDDLTRIKQSVDLSKDTAIVFINFDQNLATKTISMFPTGLFKDMNGFWVFTIEKTISIIEQNQTSQPQGCGCGSN
jgi:4-amino-4-deoxy-L-arabinose transferase-like glycosyltransferase